MNTPSTPGVAQQLEDFLKTIITDLNPEPQRKRGKPRVLPALALWAGMLVGVARGFTAQLELWRLLTAQGLWDFPRYTVTDDAVYKRLKNAAADTLKSVFEHATQLLQTRLTQPVQTLASFASGVFAVDAMTLDQVKKRLPALRAQPGASLPGVLNAVFDLRQQLWHHVSFQPEVDQNEKVAARSLLEHLPAGSLVLADLGYFAFAWFDHLTAQGFHWVSRLRAKTSYTVIHRLYEEHGVLDAIVWLGAYRADQAGRAVRLVRFTKNKTTWSYLTNVLDPRVLSLREISVLYARRWDIELMFNTVKTHLKLHVLWSAQANVVQHQVWAVFTVAQIILGLRSEIAARARVDVFEVSLDLLIRWLPRFASNGEDPVRAVVERGRAARIIRAASRMRWSVPDPGLEAYSFLSEGVVVMRVARYARKE